MAQDSRRIQIRRLQPQVHAHCRRHPARRQARSPRPRKGKARGTAPAHPDERHGCVRLPHRPDQAGGGMGASRHRDHRPRRGAGVPGGVLGCQEGGHQADSRLRGLSDRGLPGDRSEGRQPQAGRNEVRSRGRGNDGLEHRRGQDHRNRRGTHRKRRRSGQLLDADRPGARHSRKGDGADRHHRRHAARAADDRAGHRRFREVLRGLRACGAQRVVRHVVLPARVPRRESSLRLSDSGHAGAHAQLLQGAEEPQAGRAVQILRHFADERAPRRARRARHRRGAGENAERHARDQAAGQARTAERLV